MNTTYFTFPPSQPGQAIWVPSPAYRGTFNIISLCLSTVTICVWSAIHWDIPLEPLSANLDEVEGWSFGDIWKRMKRSFIIFGRFLKQRGPLVLIAIFLPALLLFRAINQYFEAQKLVKYVRRRRGTKKKASTPKKGGKRREGYVEIKGSEGLQESKDHVTRSGERDPESVQPTSGQHFEFTLVHAFYATMGGYALTVLDEHGDPIPGSEILGGHKNAKLSSDGLAFLFCTNPDLIPDVSLASIAEKTKSNALGKTIMTIQVIWFCLNCISRLVEDLPLSLLEVSTLAHGFCTLLSCAVWWRKPLNIDSPTWIRMGSDSGRETFERLSLAIEDWGWTIDELEGRGFVTFNSSPGFRDLFRAFVLDESGGFVIVSAITPIIYGSLHFLGWRAQFPTTTERILWRIATVAAMLPGVASFMAIIIFMVVKDNALEACNISIPVMGSVYEFVVSYIIPFIYSFASMYLLFESVRQLWYLSPDAFRVATWSYYVPHLF